MPAIPVPRFVTGSILRHVAIMAGTGAVGLIAVFAVDLANLFYVLLLGQKPIAAAIGEGRFADFAAATKAGWVAQDEAA